MPQALPLSTKLARDISKEINHSTLVAQFGDGYSQRAPSGLNSRKTAWSITWEYLNATDTTTVMAALDTVGSWDYLTWTPWDESVSKRFMIEPGSIRLSYVASLTTIACRLIEVF